MQMKTAYVGLGSNIGDREQTLIEAVVRLARTPGIRFAAGANLYETDPVGFVDQPAFLNTAIRVETSLAPEALLAALLETERAMGRVRDIRWGPRTLDLDLLLYDGATRFESPSLTLPHPRMLERRFVLVPLLECAEPDDEAVVELIKLALETLHDEGGVALWKTINWPDAFAPSAN